MFCYEREDTMYVYYCISVATLDRAKCMKNSSIKAIVDCRLPPPGAQPTMCNC